MVLKVAAGETSVNKAHLSTVTSYITNLIIVSEAEERLGGPAWYSYATAERIVGPLYPLYREPPRHAVQVGRRVTP